MAKRYRRPKVENGEIKFQKGKVDGDVDICIFYGDDVPRRDRSLVMIAFGSAKMHIDREKEFGVSFSPSFIEELETRGYDMDTLRFSIKKKIKDK